MDTKYCIALMAAKEAMKHLAREVCKVIVIVGWGSKHNDHNSNREFAI